MSRPVGRRDRQPKLRFPGLRARWSEELGWRFRAATQIDGRKVVGPFRETQEEAAQDYREIRSRVEDIPVRVVTLGEALDAVILDAKRRGLPASTYNVQHRGHANYLLRFWRPETRLSAITESEVIWFVKEARDLGRNPNTLIEKDLPLLNNAFDIAKVPSPVAAARKRLTTLKKRQPQRKFFTPPELRELLQRMRGWSETDATAASADADLVEFLACTGLRVGELSRLQIGDYNPKRGRLRVEESKDRGHPRDLEIIGPLVPVVERMIERARADDGEVKGERAPLFPRARTTLPNTWRRWQKRLNEPRLCGRTLRHTFVTGLLYSGSSAIETMGLAGHKHLATTDRYVHELGERRAENVQSWLSMVHKDDGEEGDHARNDLG